MQPEAPQFKKAHEKFTRLLFFCQKGLALFGMFKDLILVIIALGIALRITNLPLMVGMFLIALPAFTLTGWFMVNYMDKVIEFLQITFGSHYARSQYAIYEEIRDLLKDINKKL